MTNEAPSPRPTDDLGFMREAIAEARRAAEHGDVPVGCVVVAPDGSDAGGGTGPVGRIVGRGHNRREVDRDPTAHAEILAIREAARALGSWYLVGTTIYVTQEPCPMCAGALVNARIARLVYGCDNPKAGAVRTLFRLVDDPRLNHRLSVDRNVLAEDCAHLLTEFFRHLRATGEK